MFHRRLQHLHDALRQNQLPALVLNAGPSLNYFTGLEFHLMERPVVLLVEVDQEPILILPELEARKLEQGPMPCRPFTYPENPQHWAGVFRRALQPRRSRLSRIGVEPRQLRLLELSLLREAFGDLRTVDAARLLASIRAIKDDREIELMLQAVSIAEAALERVLPLVRVGTTEREIAAELVIHLLQQGSEAQLPFTPIVASGPNGANPHARPTDRPLAPGDLVIIDWGARWQGYCSDLTRTFAVAEIGPDAAAIHQAVWQANRAGRQAGSPGVSCGQVDLAARQTIEAAGFGFAFTHRTGHGIGLECHEEPYLHGDNTQTLQAGMTYTVEPGIYLPGRGGVRIEDEVVVTRDGCRSLSSITRQLRILG